MKFLLSPEPSYTMPDWISPGACFVLGAGGACTTGLSQFACTGHARAESGFGRIGEGKGNGRGMASASRVRQLGNYAREALSGDFREEVGL